jgi:hypothetical protein
MNFKQIWNEKVKNVIGEAVLGVVCAIAIIAGTHLCIKTTNTIFEKEPEVTYEQVLLNHTRDVYVERLESQFDAAREELAIEVDKYISTVAPNADISALNVIDLCSEYNVDIRLVLAQGHVESHFATKGTAARTNSIFNVGAYDGYSAEKQIKNGYGYRHPDFSVEPYLKLLTTRYLVDGKTEDDLLENFVDANGNRYASCTTYESMLKSKIEKMDSIADITNKYEVYKKYKLKLGR